MWWGVGVVVVIGLSVIQALSGGEVELGHWAIAWAILYSAKEVTTAIREPNK